MTITPYVDVTIEYDLNRLVPTEVGRQNFNASRVKAPLYSVDMGIIEKLDFILV